VSELSTPNEYPPRVFTSQDIKGSPPVDVVLILIIALAVLLFVDILEQTILPAVGTVGLPYIYTYNWSLILD